MEKTCRNKMFKTFNIAYSEALKKMMGIPSSVSIHAVADACIRASGDPSVKLDTLVNIKLNSALKTISNIIIKQIHLFIELNLQLIQGGPSISSL